MFCTGGTKRTECRPDLPHEAAGNAVGVCRAQHTANRSRQQSQVQFIVIQDRAAAQRMQPHRLLICGCGLEMPAAAFSERQANTVEPETNKHILRLLMTYRRLHL